MPIKVPKTLHPFINAVEKTFKILCFLDVTPGDPIIKNHKVSDKSISGIVGMVGSKYIGSFVISFTAECILNIVQKMLGEKYTEVNDAVSDTVAEITNIVFGNAKKELADMNITLEMAIPYTIRGNNHIITHKTDGPYVVIPFSSSLGTFTIEMGMEPKKKDRRG
ncbi:MAG: chemotaxis protein CheX [Oligoflexia bacterium]|nr:chemotaxis protein CheX [Oligoflexia bacterium]